MSWLSKVAAVNQECCFNLCIELNGIQCVFVTRLPNLISKLNRSILAKQRGEIEIKPRPHNLRLELCGVITRRADEERSDRLHCASGSHILHLDPGSIPRKVSLDLSSSSVASKNDNFSHLCKEEGSDEKPKMFRLRIAPHTVINSPVILRTTAVFSQQ